MSEVVIVKCPNYEEKNVKEAFDKLLKELGNLEFVKEGMKVAIKANLVTFMKPESAATTHPSVLCELVKRLVEKGAEVTVGDSPGGLYNQVYVNRVYNVAGMKEIEKVGGKLNQNFEEEVAHYADGKILKEFPYTKYLDEADVIINFCKLKTHGMMGMSAAVKNMFGVIPGTIKPEFHFRYPKYEDFADMLIDLNEYFKPSLYIVDGIVGMEGNGPTAGTPRDVGLLLGSKNPYALDLICAKIIGVEAKDIPTVEGAYKRGLAPIDYKEVSCNEDIDKFLINDYKIMPPHGKLGFTDTDTLWGKFVQKAIRSVPKIKREMCVGCGKCKEVCPMKTIDIKNGKAVIHRKKCITCFCCQEFCPKGAIKVKRPIVAKLLNK